MSSSIAPAALLFVLVSSPVFAQAPPPEPPKIWTESFNAGLALTSGNSDTSTVNLGYEITYDPQTRNRIKSDGLYLRGTTEGELSAQRLALNGRDEYRLTQRSFVFGQMQFLRDRFKEIDYLVAPTGGVGYRLLDSPRTMLSVDTGLGTVWEKNTGVDVATSGAFTYAEKLTHQLTSTAKLTESLSALHRTNDFEDALFQFGVGIAATVSARTQLKVELLDIYKTRPPSAAIVKNDVAVIVALVYKN